VSREQLAGGWDPEPPGGRLPSGAGRPFRVGTTSYIVPDRLLPNVRFLAGRVEDIELLLFEMDGLDDALPTGEELDELQALAAAHGIGYTVHLPLDLRLGAEGAHWSRNVTVARRVVEATRRLDPRAWVVHVEGDGDPPGPPRRGPAVRALEQIALAARDPRLIAVENLEGNRPDTLDSLVNESGVSRCVDVGHLWLEGHAPAPFLEAVLDRTRVIHLHGVGDRDHVSLAEQEVDEVVAVLEVLVRRAWGGVVTLEVFDRVALASSERALAEALFRVQGEAGPP